MKTQCPNCKAVQDVPAEYIGKDVTCRRCNELFVAEKFKKPPIVIPPVLPSTGNFITKAWKRTPIAFKTSFLATLGVITALLLTFYLYGNVLVKTSRSDIQGVKSQLFKEKLFPVNQFGKSGVLRGRILDEYKFVPDASQPYPYLSVWLDENYKLAGISAVWFGAPNGYPADIHSDKQEYFRNYCACKGFQTLTGYDLTNFDISKFTIKTDSAITSEDYFEYYGKWHIVVSRTKSSLKGSDVHKRMCTTMKMENAVYSFTATAQNW